ncbi:MAG: signal peptidase II, partial [Gammaproteobacteria bacterium]|nr:signal peptidase II [Gammaproteobacteria bacterium]
VVWMTIAVIIVIVDQLTKLAIIDHLDLYGKVSLTPWLNLTHQRNYGAAFSFLADAGGWQRWFFVALAATVSAVLVVWTWRIRYEGPVILVAGLALVLGGAVGNLIDRIWLGYVTDFIQVNLPIPFFDPFPSFNVADSAITVGAVLLIIDSIFFSGRGSPDNGQSTAS